MSQDPVPADIVSYEDAIARFQRARPKEPNPIVGQSRDFELFTLWRIAEQLERLADYSMVDTMDEPPVEPWRDNGEDDE